MDIARRVLTEKQLRIWLLHEVQGVGWKQIAVMLGVSSATVREANKRAMQLIGKELAYVEDQISDGPGPDARGAATDGGAGDQGGGPDRTAA